MRTRSKFLLAGLAAALLLSIAVTSATAGRLSVSSRSFTITWNSLNLSTTGGIGPIRCPTTLSGTFHSATMSKITGALVGSVNRGTINNAGCTGGRATVNQEALPWHVRYRAFRGTLPTISGVDFSLVGGKFTTEASGLSCTSITTAANPLVGIVNLGSGRVTSLTPDPSAIIPLRGAFLCGFSGSGTFEGTSSSVTALTITLI